MQKISEAKDEELHLQFRSSLLLLGQGFQSPFLVPSSFCLVFTLVRVQSLTWSTYELKYKCSAVKSGARPAGRVGTCQSSLPFNDNKVQVGSKILLRIVNIRMYNDNVTESLQETTELSVVCKIKFHF